MTGERIRDKIAASKARGIWMGGNIPIGYDLRDRILVPNESEAQSVRHIYQRYLELKSLPALAKDLTATGILTKRWTSRSGRPHGGIAFNCSGLSLILKNRIYLGEIVHRGKAHPGKHEAIVPQDPFDAVQAQLAANHHRHRTRKTRAATCPLTGKIFDDDGLPMRPSFSYGRGKKTYRYYVSECLLPNGRIANGGNLNGMRLPATRIEKLLFQAISDLLPEPAAPDAIFEAIHKVAASPNRLRVSLEPARLQASTLTPVALLEQVRSAIDPDAEQADGTLTFSIEMPPQRRGRTIARKQPPRTSQAEQEELADLLRAAHRKLAHHNASPLDPGRHQHMRAPTDAWTRARIAIGLLAPDIQKAILQGNLPAPIDPDQLLSTNLPLDWNEQRRLFGLVG